LCVPLPCDMTRFNFLPPFYKLPPDPPHPLFPQASPYYSCCVRSFSLPVSRRPRSIFDFVVFFCGNSYGGFPPETPTLRLSGLLGNFCPFSRFLSDSSLPSPSHVSFSPPPLFRWKRGVFLESPRFVVSSTIPLVLFVTPLVPSLLWGLGFSLFCVV